MYDIKTAIPKEGIIYEQPIHELSRIAGRAQYLFQQIDQIGINLVTPYHSRIFMRWMIELMQLLDRPDLKSKLSKEFSRLINVFSGFQNAPDISHTTLNQTLQHLKNMVNGYLLSRGKPADQLRTNDFMSQLKQSILNPGGDSPTDIPRYHWWLNRSMQEQREMLLAWLDEFKEIRAAIDLYLDIIRNSPEPKKLIAEKGFYLQTLDPELPLQMIRVGIASDKNLYPMISVGLHRVSISFMEPHVDLRAKQTNENVAFEFTCCII